MKKMVYLVGWEYWDNNRYEYKKVTKVYENKEERDACYNGLCPVVHEYAWKEDKEMTNEEIDKINNPEKYAKVLNKYALPF